MTATKEIKKRRSVRLDPKLKTKLSKWYTKFKVKAEAEDEIKINFRVLDNTLLRGTCSPDTKIRIQNFFN